MAVIVFRGNTMQHMMNILCARKGMRGANTASPSGNKHIAQRELGMTALQYLRRSLRT